MKRNTKKAITAKRKPPVNRKLVVKTRHAKAFAIRQARTLAGLTQEDLAFKLNVAADTVSLWECAKRSPRPATWKKLLEFLPSLANWMGETSRNIIPSYEKFSSPNKDRAYSRKSELERTSNTSPASSKLWMRTNHSESKITLTSANSADIDKAFALARAHYHGYVPNPKTVATLDHARPNNVFRVADADSSRRPIFLKRYKQKRSASQMVTITSAQSTIADSDIFEDFGQYVRPLVTSANSLWVQNDDDSGQVIASYFFDELRSGHVTHFEGRTLKEIRDVAAKFGQVNHILGDAKIGPNPGQTFPMDENFWAVIIDLIVGSGGNKQLPKTIQLAHAHVDLIRKAFEDVVKVVGPHIAQKPTVPVTLTDLHPHNVFVAHERCLLIFDYEEARNDWPEVANCAFALHRFCREYVRRQKEKGGSERDLRQAMEQSAATFYLGYKTARQRSVIDEVLKNGISWAKAINLSKLISNVAYELGKKEDRLKRTPQEHFNEVTKFVMYLQELEFLGRTGWTKAST